MGQDIGNSNPNANVKDPDMSIDPILSAPVYLQIHVVSALLSILLGPVPMYRRKRDRIHKGFGYVWVVAMATVAVSSFWIHSFAVIGPFSPLHGLAVLTVWSLWNGIRHARAGNIRVHRIIFRNLYWYGLMIAGLANFLPDRRMNEVIFGGQDQWGWLVIAAGGCAIAVAVIRGRRDAQKQVAQAAAQVS